MASTPACPSGATSTRASAMPGVSMPATRTATASARCTSTRSRGSGPCCAPGSARTGASRKTSCRFTSASSSSCTMHAVAAKPSSARSLPLWSHDSPDQHPGSQQEPTTIANIRLTGPVAFYLSGRGTARGRGGVALGVKVMNGPAVRVVEDAPQTRAAAVQLFQDLGCEVFAAYNGHSALTILEAHPEIQVLFADVRMPGMSGPELAQLARRLRPDLR